MLSETASARMAFIAVLRISTASQSNGTYFCVEIQPRRRAEIRRRCAIPSSGKGDFLSYDMSRYRLFGVKRFIT